MLGRLDEVLIEYKPGKEVEEIEGKKGKGSKGEEEAASGFSL